MWQNKHQKNDDRYITHVFSLAKDCWKSVLDFSYQICDWIVNYIYS